MIFALNYSPQAGRLFNEGILVLDAFKCPDFPDMIARARVHLPVVVHFPIEVGTGELARGDINLQAIEEMATDTETRLINCHLVSRRRHHQKMVGHAPSAADTREFIDTALADLAVLTGHFGPRRVAVENLIYNGPPKSGVVEDDWLLPGVQAEVISEVVGSAGVGFLLDLSHARIAAHYAGWDAKTYISSLPVAVLSELHLTGLGMHNGLLTDHLPLTDDDWAFTQWALDEIKRGHWATPDVIASEYGGEGPPFSWRTDASVIADQTPRLFDLAHAACD